MQGMKKIVAGVVSAAMMLSCVPVFTQGTAESIGGGVNINRKQRR